MKNNTFSREELVRLFVDPPLEYGDFLTYFWESGQLSKDRLTWQLEQLQKKGVAGTWYYPRYVEGEPYGTHPPYWSEGWWEFFEHYVAEHQRLGMTAWFSDWTGRGYWQDQLRIEKEQHPELEGRRLVIHQVEVQGGNQARIEVPDNEEILAAGAYRRTPGKLDHDSGQDLKSALQGQGLSWSAPEGDWLVAVVASQPHDLNYLDRAVADRWLELYWEPHAQKLRPFVGQTLKGYLQDEMNVLDGNMVYSPSLLERFMAERGYDPRLYLVGLFHDIGDFTDKIRCDYYEVMSTLLEENLYRPLSDWCEERGMLFGTIATWGRQDLLGQTYHYGDFFRLCRWFHITGNEDPGTSEPGERRFIDAKLSSSILHLYQRERAGMCVYWGSGHGMTQEENLAWTHENMAYGLNLYNTHGGLYSSLGSWYEWVPPSVHFRQPYWEHWKTFVDYISRLSVLLSHGVHRADVALLYPLTSIHANWLRGDHFTAAADETAAATFALARHLYESGIDFDFIDNLKLSEAEVSEGRLRVAGLEFRAILLPPMTTIRTDVLEKIKAFYDSGGTVVACRRLPSASPEQGRNDPRIRALVEEIFGFPASQEYVHAASIHRQAEDSVHIQENARGGKAIFVPEHEEHRGSARFDPDMQRHDCRVPAAIASAIARDVVASGKNVLHTHQKIGELDLYFLYNLSPEKRSLHFTFRVVGEPEIWDASTGRITPWHRFERGEGTTRVRLDMERYQALLLAFTPGPEQPAVLEDNLKSIARVEEEAEGLKVEGLAAEGGSKQVRILHQGREYIGRTRLAPPPSPIHLEGEWDFQLVPTMDNQWGDYRHPAADECIGPEARRFRYMKEGASAGKELGWHQAAFDDAAWLEFIYSFGPHWYALGPLSPGQEPEEREEWMAGQIGQVAGTSCQWEPHVYSQTIGHAAPEMYRSFDGMHGVDDHFLYFPATDSDLEAARYLFTWVCAPEKGTWDFHFGHAAEAEGHATCCAWVNGQPVAELGPDEREQVVRVSLEKGPNPVLLKLIHYQGQPIRAFAAFMDPGKPALAELPPPPQLKWFADPCAPVYDIAPHQIGSVGWYRFEAPPGTRTMHLALEAEEVQAWVEGRPAAIQNGRIQLAAPKEGVAQVALRIVQKPGRYAGAAMAGPVRFECEPTRVPLGDWCAHALESYSGGAIYCKTFALGAEHLQARTVLDLGQVQVTAEVAVNGRTVDTGLARPYCFDLTDFVREGENELEVRVFNTLANHYSVGLPSPYVFPGQTISGLLGPVALQFLTRANLTARPAISAHEVNES